MEKWIKELDELTTHIDEWTDEEISQAAYRLFEANPRYEPGTMSRKVLWSEGTKADLGVLVRKFKSMLDRLEVKYPDYNERMRIKRGGKVVRHGPDHG